MQARSWVVCRVRRDQSVVLFGLAATKARSMESSSTPYRLADEPPVEYTPVILAIFAFVCIFESILVSIACYNDASLERLVIGGVFLMVLWMPWMALCAKKPPSKKHLIPEW